MAERSDERKRQLRDTEGSADINNARVAHG